MCLPSSTRLFIEYMYYKRFVEAEVELIRKLCDPRKISLDIGANNGGMTLFLSRFSEKVYCFEPIPALCDHLRSRFERRNVIVECCALGDRNEEAYLNIPCINGDLYYGWSSLSKEFNNEIIYGKCVDNVERLKVFVNRLDDYNFNNVGFIKMDVEGYEMNVLRGAVNTIKASMPNMCIEIEKRHHGGDEIDRIFKYILDIGYHGFFIWKEHTYAIDKFDVNVMQDINNEEKSRYVSNIFFSVKDIF